MPLLLNSPPSQYQNKGKIWAIRAAPDGMVYMAADKGLLRYDGETWHSYKGSEGFTRSLLVVNDSLIYTGSDLDFGVWKRSRFYHFEYSSLYPFREELMDLNEEFWSVHQVDNNIFFVSASNIYVYKNGQLTKIPAPSRLTGSFVANGTLYFADERSGLFELKDLSLTPITKFPEDRDFEVKGIYRRGQDMVLVTKNSGLFAFTSGELRPLDTPLSRALKTDKVFSFEKIGDAHLAFGTVLKGLFISDLQGNIIHRINKNKGLPNNTILSLHHSADGKLWMGMDYGVSSLMLNNNLTFFQDYRGDFGTGYTALLKGGVFYLGANQGLYQARWEDLNNSAEFYRFQLVPGTEGQVWELKNFQGDLLIGHDKGLFVWKDGRLEPLTKQRGVWTVLPYKDYLLAGTYNGIFIFKRSDGRWVFLKQMDQILGSCNQLLLEGENILWVNIPNYGIIRTLLDEDLNPYERRIFPKESFEGDELYLKRHEHGVRVITDKFQFAYSAAENRFSKVQGVDDQPRIEGLLPGIFQPAALNAEFEFFPMHNGFALHFSGNSLSSGAVQTKPVFTGLEVFDQGDWRTLSSGDGIPYRLNNLRIAYILPNQEHVQYQYRLDKNGEWSSWEADHIFEGIGLKHGEHQLAVRARVRGEVTEASVLVFRVAAPWYKTWYAYSLFLVLAALGIYLIYVWQGYSLKRQKRQWLVDQQSTLREQEEKHRQHILFLEQERLQADYETLKRQLRNKTIELASKAKENEDKNRLLLDLKEKIQSIQNKPDISSKRWQEIYKLLDSYKDLHDNTLEIQMDELHQELFKKLKTQFPGLSNNDLRLCAYLKTGLNTKEIAELQGILPSSVFISRSRLRKKLNLEAEEDLQDFLNQL